MEIVLVCMITASSWIVRVFKIYIIKIQPTQETICDRIKWVYFEDSIRVTQTICFSL